MHEGMGAEVPATYAALLQRDVFEPLGMKGSHFLATEANKAHIVVPAVMPEVAVRIDSMHAVAKLSDLSC